MLENISDNKSNICERDWSKFDLEIFSLDYFSVDLKDLLKIDELNADNSTKMHSDKINMLLDTRASLKRINKSISVKNNLLTSFINKETLH